MWTGDGWIRTRRQLGVAGLIAIFAVEVGLGVTVYIGLYGLIASLLGLGELADALSGIRVGGKR